MTVYNKQNFLIITIILHFAFVANNASGFRLPFGYLVFKMAAKSQYQTAKGDNY